ncbi:MAG TPA: STAS domain-containing protein [Candidatus Cybelea sp.]|nr:STAS domain-containing protein [Candidatus Cybelea sp.]
MTDEKLQMIAAKGTRSGLSILRLTGPLSIHTLFAFHDAVRKDPPPALILDFSGVPYMDSAGLGVLVGAQVTAQKAGRTLAITGINQQVRALLEMTHVLGIFQLFQTVEEAEAGLAAQPRQSSPG